MVPQSSGMRLRTEIALSWQEMEEKSCHLVQDNTLQPIKLSKIGIIYGEMPNKSLTIFLYDMAAIFNFTWRSTTVISTKEFGTSLSSSFGGKRNIPETKMDALEQEDLYS